MIKSFRHKGVEQFFHTKSKRGIQSQHAHKLSLLLGALDVATTAAEMNYPGWKLHKLRGELADHWAVTVNGNWRLTFTFEDQDAILVDYLDYH